MTEHVAPMAIREPSNETDAEHRANATALSAQTASMNLTSDRERQLIYLVLLLVLVLTIAGLAVTGRISHSYYSEIMRVSIPRQTGQG